MDKLLFASAYRSAAILAAFSGATAPEEEPTWVALPADALPATPARGWRTALARIPQGAARAIAAFRFGRLGRPDRSVESDAPRRRPPARPAPFPPAADATRERALVSHFAFCDEVDFSHPGTTL